MVEDILANGLPKLLSNLFSLHFSTVRHTMWFILCYTSFQPIATCAVEITPPSLVHLICNPSPLYSFLLVHPQHICFSLLHSKLHIAIGIVYMYMLIRIKTYYIHTIYAAVSECLSLSIYCSGIIRRNRSWSVAGHTELSLCGLLSSFIGIAYSIVGSIYWEGGVFCIGASSPEGAGERDKK